jgi:two-component sensor histidine kinase
MALIHETLYNTNEFENIKIDTYVQSLISYINKAYDISNINLITNIQDITLSVDSATSCGMIIMELVTNSLKYAFPEEQNPQIEIIINELDKDKIQLIVSDNGVGFPENIDFKTTSSLGMQIIMSLVDQNEGGIILNRETNGTCFEISIYKFERNHLKMSK